MAIRKKQVILLTVIPVVIVIAVVAGVVYLLNAGILYAGVKTADQKVLVYQNVCSDDLKNRFVTVMQPTSSDEKGTIDTIHEEVEGLTDWATDPSCVYMNIQYYVTQGDAEKVSDLVRSYSSLGESGRFADPVVSRYGYSGATAESTAILFKEGKMNSGQGGGI